MDNKHFKKLLKESISNGASILFEEEEEVEVPDAIAQDEEDGAVENTPKIASDVEKKLSQQLTQASSLVSQIKNSQNLSVETFSQIIAYYFMAMYYDDPDDWKASLSNTQIFNTNLGGIFKDHEKRNENIVCTFNEALDWVLNYPAYKNPDIWVASLKTKKDQDLISKLSNTLNKIEKKGFALSSKNEEYLKKLIAKLGPDFKMSECPSDPKTTADDKQDKERDSKAQPMPLSDLLSMLQQGEAKEFADKIFQAMKKDMPDLRINEAKKEKTPLLSNTIEILKSIEDKEIQQIAWKSILKFLRKNRLQIGDKTKSQLTKAGILTRVAKDDIEDAETEEISIEDLVTPSSKQNFPIFARRLQQIPFPRVREYVVGIIQAVSNDVQKAGRLGSLKGNTIEEQEPRGLAIRIPNVISLLKKIREEKGKLTAGQVYVLIQRFLTRNELQIKESDKIIIDKLSIDLDREDTLQFLQKVHSRNLEEQRYYRLLERFNIK